MSKQLHPDESGKDCVVRGGGATKQNLQRHSLESQGGATTCHSCGGQRNYQSSLDYSMADFSPPLGGGISGGDMATYKSQRKRFFGFLSKKKRSDGSKVLTSSCFCGRLERLSCRGRRTSTDIQSRDAPSADECEPSSSGADIQPRTTAAIDCPELSSAGEDSLAASSLEISNECRSTLLTSSSSRMQPPPATPQRRFDHSLDPLNIATASLTRRDMSAATRRDERSFGLQQLCCTLSSVDSLASSPTADSGSTNRINDRRLVSTTVYPMAHLASNRMPGICGEDLVFTYPSDVDDTLSPGMSSLSTDAVATTSTGSVASDVGEFCCHVPRRIHTQVDYVHCLVPDLQRIASCSYYWGVMDRYEAERLLDARPEGTFLLRDSAQDEFLFSVSFRRYSRSLHARVEQWNHQFSFDSHDLSVFSSPSVCELIEHYKDPASCMFFEPMLTAPLARTFPFSLQALCRTAICSATTYDGIGFLPIPKSLHQYLQYYHYKQKVHVRRFESPGAAAASGVPRPPLPPMPNGLHAGSRGTSTSVGLPVMLEEQADTPV